MSSLMQGASGPTTSVATNLPSYAIIDATNYLNQALAISGKNTDGSTNATYDADFVAYVVAGNPAYTDYPTESVTTGTSIPTNVSTYADLPVNERDGITALASRGRNHNATITKGITLVQDIESGNYLPGITANFQTALANITGKPTVSFATIRTLLGGPSYLIGDLSGENQAYMLTAATPTRYNDRASGAVYNDNYQSERSIQDTAIKVGLAYSHQSIEDAELLRKAGMYYRLWNQGYYEDLYKKWKEGQVLKLRRPEVVGNAIRTLVGSQTTTTGQYHRPSPLVGIAGGALAGLPLAVQTGGLSMLGGAVLGGIASTQ